MRERFPDGAFGYGKQWLSKQLRPKRQVTYIHPWFSHRVSLIYPRCRRLLRPNRQFPNIYKIWIKNQIYTQDNDKVSLGSSPCQSPAFRIQPDPINVNAAPPLLAEAVEKVFLGPLGAGSIRRRPHERDNKHRSGALDSIVAPSRSPVAFFNNLCRPRT